MPCRYNRLTRENLQNAPVGAFVEFPPPSWSYDNFPWRVTQIQEDEWNFNVDPESMVRSTSELWGWLVDEDYEGEVQIETLSIQMSEYAL